VVSITISIQQLLSHLVHPTVVNVQFGASNSRTQIEDQDTLFFATNVEQERIEIFLSSR
jgi:hypothetical protein